jgi:hypothetical protein
MSLVPLRDLGCKIITQDPRKSPGTRRGARLGVRLRPDDGRNRRGHPWRSGPLPRHGWSGVSFKSEGVGPPRVRHFPVILVDVFFE